MAAPLSRRQMVLDGLLAARGLDLQAAPDALPMAAKPPAASSPAMAPGWPIGLDPLDDRPCPDVPLLVQTGERTRLRALLAGRCCAVQFMFTTCSTVCGVEGARFAALAQALRLQDLRLLSLSIDVLGDDAARLRQWRSRFPADARWLAAVPGPESIEALMQHLRGEAASTQSHSTQVYLLDRRGRLCHRSANAPAVADLAARLLQLQRQG